MLKGEKALAEYYGGLIEAERKDLGPAPAFVPRPDSERRARARVDFFSGLAAAALAACCACAAPFLPNRCFAAAAETISETRIDGTQAMEFIRAIGSSFISRHGNNGGS